MQMSLPKVTVTLRFSPKKEPADSEDIVPYAEPRGFPLIINFLSERLLEAWGTRELEQHLYYGHEIIS
jgi:hypothetical protein